MNIESIKKAIAEAIPCNVGVSNIDVKEQNGQLSINIEYAKQATTVSNDCNFFDFIQPASNFAFADGYIQHPLFSYRDQLRAEYEKTLKESNKDLLLKEFAKKITTESVKTDKYSIKTDKHVAIDEDKYIKSLIRCGLSKETAEEICQRRNKTFIQPEIIKPTASSKTEGGKVITEVELPIPKQEPHSFYNEDTKKKMAGYFKRLENDGYITIVDGKSKIIDGYEKPRFAKKAFEVVAEYKKAVESYEKRYGRKLNPDNKGKREVAAVSAFPQRFSDQTRPVTDVEIMFLANEKMAKLVDSPKVSLVQDLKDIIAKCPRPTKLQKILFHLKAIKSEILRKSDG